MTENCNKTAVNAGGAAAASGFAFQQQLGAYFSALVLSQRPIDDSFNLGNTVPVSVRFETEAPVDDILIGTSENGFIAVQAKTSLSLSSNLGSPFASTISQFVRHWLACRENSTNEWERPLDPEIDRLGVCRI